MESKRRYVIVTTAHKGVFAGYTEDSTGSTVVLEEARCAIFWATSKGWLELAEIGPNSRSKISSTAPRLELRDITGVADVTPEAEKKWKEA
jgi:hypothetical protein